MYNVDIKISKLLPIGCMYKLPCHVFDYYKVDNVCLLSYTYPYIESNFRRRIENKTRWSKTCY